MTCEHPPALLTRGAVVATVLLVVTLPWPLLLGLANASYLMVLAATVPAWLLLGALHEPEERRVFARIALIALSARVVAHLAVFGWAWTWGGPYLGPDGTMYFRESAELAARGFTVEESPALFFGSYDCAHYYLFAAVRSVFDADLYAIQTFNLALTAFAGPLFYSGWRSLGLRYAIALGVGVALHPSIVALSINDMLKDPSVFGVTVIGIWSLVRLTRPTRGGQTAALVALATASFVYVRMARFYVVAFMEVAIVGALVLAWLVGRHRGWHLRRAPAAALLITFGLVEALPGLVGWPATPRLLVAAVTHTVATPLMRNYAVGLLDSLRGGPSPPVDDQKPGSASHDTGRQPRPVPGARRPTLTMSEPTAPERRRPDQSVPTPSAAAGGVRLAVNGVRKVLGPFPWIPPATWTPREVLLNDFLLFPGMLIWYAVFPVSLLGLGTIAWGRWKNEAQPFAILVLGLFCVLLMTQYLALNLSYRQREFFVPFLAAVAVLALQSGVVNRGWKLAYRAYWVLLVAMAAAHLAFRASMA